MKIPNYSYRKVTCCKTNSWKSGGRHSRVFQVFPDISISLTHKQTPRQILILTQMTHQRFWMWFHDWQSHLQGNEVVPASLAASRQPNSKGYWSAGEVEEEGCHAEIKITEKSWIRIPGSTLTASRGAFLLHCFHPYFYICGLSSVPGAVQSSTDKGKSCSHGA